MLFAGATRPDEFTLNAADRGGRYNPTSDSMAFAQPIPDEFPYLDMPSMREADIGQFASVLEEFAHRFQFQATHFGFVYRLSCLIQACKVLEILTWLGEAPARHLPLPWKDAKPPDPWLKEELADIHALEDLRRILFGLSVSDRAAVSEFVRSLDRVKALVHQYTPVSLQHFSTFGGIEDFYDENGRVNVRKTTRAIVESHASSFAFEFLRRHAPRGLEDPINDFIKQNRRGLYRTVEEIAASLDKPVAMDLAAVLRLGDFALDGKLIDVRTVPPPEDYVESTLPYNRYARVIDRFDAIVQAGRRTGLGDLTLHELVEGAIHIFGDDRGIPTRMGMDKPKILEARHIQLRAEQEDQLRWLEDEEASNPLSDCGTFLRREIGWASQKFMQGILSFEPDARRFDPTITGLVTMCRIIDLPLIEYPDGVELFRCEPQDIEMPFLAWRLSVHGIVTLAPMLMRSDLADVMQQSDALEAHQVPGMTRLQQSLKFSVSQLS